MSNDIFIGLSQHLHHPAGLLQGSLSECPSDNPNNPHPPGLYTSLEAAPTPVNLKS